MVKIEFASFPPNNKKEIIKFALRIAINAYASKIIKPYNFVELLTIRRCNLSHCTSLGKEGEWRYTATSP
jgi:hypothetical protein